MAAASTFQIVRPIVSSATMEDYLRLLKQGQTGSREHERTGPNHGDRGPEFAQWLCNVAEPWFSSIESLALDDRLHVKTFQGFEECLSGSTPCAQLLDRNGDSILLSTRDPDLDATLVSACGEVLLAARARRGLHAPSPFRPRRIDV